ncbi:unnamed protein product, partial [Onchocerca flexuosa]|uniref:Uncharacterized protein n=1 Tax=Onchocerca flexuosa TaxID=387005 RepID=A0A183HXG6_9BILA
MKCFPEDELKSGIEKERIRKNTVPKWDGKKVQRLSTSHAVILPRATSAINKETEKMTTDKKDIGAIVKRRNTNDLKSIHEQNSDFQFQSNSENKTKSPLIRLNRQKDQIPLHIAFHNLKDKEENEKKLHDDFKRQSNNQNKRIISNGSKEGNKYGSSDTIARNGTDASSYTKFNETNVSANHDIGLQAAPSNHRPQSVPGTQDNALFSSNNIEKYSSTVEKEPQSNYVKESRSTYGKEQQGNYRKNPQSSHGEKRQSSYEEKRQSGYKSIIVKEPQSSYEEKPQISYGQKPQNGSGKRPQSTSREKPQSSYEEIPQS